MHEVALPQPAQRKRTSFPATAKFIYPWRQYQQRVLNELQGHLQDNHLHVVAPPGSGKTVLGLEVVLRLNKPTLVLAPTVAIKNQWIQRFCELFLQEQTTPDWISRNIRKPAFLTVATYQALHAACNVASDADTSEDEAKVETEEAAADVTSSSTKDPFLKDVVAQLKALQIGTIVVDEAHHLKNEWW